MTDFEKRREEYFDMIRANPQLLVKLYEKEENKNAKMLEIMIAPKTERELDLALAVWIFMDDLYNIAYDIRNNRLKKIDPEESIAVNYLIQLVNAFKNNDEEKVNEIKSYLSKEMDSKEAAKIIYDFMVGFGSNPNSIFDYIMNKCEVDINDELSVLQFQMYLGKTAQILNDNNNTIDFSTIDINNSDRVTHVIEISKEFHRLYEEAKSFDGGAYSKRK